MHVWVQTKQETGHKNYVHKTCATGKGSATNTTKYIGWTPDGPYLVLLGCNASEKSDGWLAAGRGAVC